MLKGIKNFTAPWQCKIASNQYIYKLYYTLARHIFCYESRFFSFDLFLSIYIYGKRKISKKTFSMSEIIFLIFYKKGSSEKNTANIAIFP